MNRHNAETQGAKMPGMFEELAECSLISHDGTRPRVVLSRTWLLWYSQGGGVSVHDNQQHNECLMRC